MSSVCDHCHDRCVKVMTARAKVIITGSETLKLCIK